MASWGNGKRDDANTLKTIRNIPLPSGAYPTPMGDGGDTDPMSINLGDLGIHEDEFDESEPTRTDDPRVTPDVTEAHALSQEDARAFDTADGLEAAAGGDDGDDADDAPGEWRFDDWDGFWMRVHAIEAAGNESDEALEAALRRHGLRDKAHFDEVREAFQGRFGHDPAFMQAALDARTRATKQAMQARMQGELKGELAPVDGVTLEQWAWLMAKIASGGNLGELLGLARMDAGKWERVSAEWNARMSRDTTATIATAYGQAFVATGPGPFGEAGKQTAAAMLDPNKRGVDGGPPIPMEKWIEITEAQNAAAQRGEDAAALLARYGMTPADWGVVGGWWSQHFNANAMKLIGEYNRLSEHYRRKFAR